MYGTECLVNELEHLLSEANVNLNSKVVHHIVPEGLIKRSTIIELIEYSLIDWSIIIFCWIGISVSLYWLYPIWVLLIAGRLHALGVILHDATHMALRSKTFGVRMVEILAGYPVASTLNAMRYHHLRHHRDNGMSKDPYFKPNLYGKSKSYFFIFWLRYITLMPLWTIRVPYGLLSIIFPSMRESYAKIFLQDRSGQPLTDMSEVINCARAEFGQFLFQIVIFTLTLFYPITMIYGYLLPLMITSLLAGYRVLVEHNYFPAKDRSIKAIFETTNDHNLNLLGKLILAPRNVGCHIVHHLHPQVGLKYLPHLRDWYKEMYIEYYPSAKYLGF